MGRLERRLLKSKRTKKAVKSVPIGLGWYGDGTGDVDYDRQTVFELELQRRYEQLLEDLPEETAKLLVKAETALYDRLQSEWYPDGLPEDCDRYLQMVHDRGGELKVLEMAHFQRMLFVYGGLPGATEAKDEGNAGGTGAAAGGA